MMIGKFITVEGTDGAGKSTQIKLLVEYLQNKGFDVVVTREPGGTSISEKIREIILDVDNSEMSDITEALLYAASRAQHISQKIKPAVAAGKIVICDRFVDSSVAYQGYARGLKMSLIEDVNRYAVDDMTPDVTLFFDIKPEIGIARKKNVQSLDRIEKETLDFHYKVYNGYKELLRKYPQRIKRIDAQKDVEEVHAQVVEVLKQIL
ncbi:MAG TPA: dTMP kinase [Lachnospiraceae bacterium]|nr:dTMP kinase [Lachnospiraceae bacterium]